MAFELRIKRPAGGAASSTPFVTVWPKGIFISSATRKELGYSRVSIMVDEENQLIRLAPTDSRTGYNIAKNGAVGIHRLGLVPGRYVPNGDELTFKLRNSDEA